MARPFNPAHKRTRDRGGRRALQVYLPLDLHADIHDAARRRGISASEFVTRLLDRIDRKPRCYRIHAKYRMRTFINGDCIPAMQNLAGSSINLIVTSPPYNIKKSYGTHADNLTLDEYIAFAKTWMTEAARVLHEDGSLWVNVGNMKHPNGGCLPLEYLYYPIGVELGLTLVQSIVWHHQTGKPQRNRLTQITERWQWWTKKPKGYTWNLDDIRIAPKLKPDGSFVDKRNHALGKNPSDLWNFPTLTHNAKARPAHPCPFPIAMIERVIKGCSNVGDTILDPFGGSGTTALAAALHGRKFVSIELDPTFHEVAVARYTNAGFDPPDLPQEAAE